MNKRQSFLEKLRNNTIAYSNPVYDPTYVYQPWKKWVIAGAILSLCAVAWLFLILGTASPRSAPVGNAVPIVAPSTDTEVLQRQLYAVVKVIDGDTLDVIIDGKTERIRLIGVDTPETVDPRKTVQCFGKEASDKAKETLQGAKVSLEKDPTQGERDKYSRILAYVFLEDGTNFNEYMIAEGYAHEYTYNTPYKYKEQFKAAQVKASEGNKGLWSPSTCNGDTTSGLVAPVPTPEVPNKVKQPAARIADNCDPNYTPCIPYVSYDLDCADVGTSVRVIGTDVHRLDRDGDSYGCESY